MITLPAATSATTEYESFYESTLAAPLSDSDTDIYLTNLPSAAVGFLVIDPLGANPEIVYYNVVGANYVRVPSAVDGEGRGVGNTTPQPFDAGTKVGMYSIGEFFEGVVSGLLMRDGFLQTRHFSASVNPNSWIGAGETWNYVGNNGQREYQYVVAGDKRSKYSDGMKVRLPRLSSLGTMSAYFAAVGSPFANKSTPANITFTTYTAEAWINVTSATTNMVIIGRSDGANNYWLFRVNSNGQVGIYGSNTAAPDGVISVPSLPMGRRVHVAATFTVGGVGTIWFDGVPVTTTSLNGSTTAIGQAGDLALGYRPGVGEYFDGQISDVRVWSTVRTQSQIRDNMNKRLVGNEVGLVAYYKLDGNFNDSTANVNHMTSGGGAIATLASSFFNDNEYGFITGVSYAAGNSTVTVWCGADFNAPADNLTGVAYTSAKSPYGFPLDQEKWTIIALFAVDSSSTISTSFTTTGQSILVPSGAWELSYKIAAFITHSNSGATRFASFTMSSGLTTETHPLLTTAVGNSLPSAVSSTLRGLLSARQGIQLAAPVTYTALVKVNATSPVTGADIAGSGVLPSVYLAKSNYL